MNSSFLRRAVAATLVFCTVTPNLWAWGREGHRITALVAENYLTPATQAAIKDLLGKDTLEGVAPWADEYRGQHPETGPWHFADVPKDQAKYDRVRDCPASTTDPNATWHDCVVERILYFEMRLADKSLSHDERAEALKFLVHFVGDIHQPLHVIGDDRGGNDIHVTFLGSKQCGGYNCNLHGVWDSEMIDHHGMPEKKYVAYLVTDIDEHNWQKLAGGNPVQWANASHQYAVNAYAPNGAFIMKDYYDEEIKVVDSQLALGGLRLARVLNTILGGEAVPPMPLDPKAPARVPMAKPQ